MTRSRDGNHHQPIDPAMRKNNDMLKMGCLALCIWLATTSAMAAGTEFHILGVVTAIDGKHIEVKTAKGSVTSVLLSKQVKYKNKSHPNVGDPPAVGDRVIIEVSKDDKTKKVTATVVHYSAVKHTPPSQ